MKCLYYHLVTPIPMCQWYRTFKKCVSSNESNKRLCICYSFIQIKYISEYVLGECNQSGRVLEGGRKNFGEDCISHLSYKTAFDGIYWECI